MQYFQYLFIAIYLYATYYLLNFTHLEENEKIRIRVRIRIRVKYKVFEFSSENEIKFCAFSHLNGCFSCHEETLFANENFFICVKNFF